MARIISQATAHRIWLAHREIAEGEKLLADMRETAERSTLTPIDRWDRGYQLCVPSGSGHRILDLSPILAASIVEAHIADKRRDLEHASIAASVEVNGTGADAAFCRTVTDPAA